MSIYRSPLLAACLLAALATVATHPGADAALPATALSQDLDLLMRMHVIVTPAYWREHAVEGGQCDGPEVASLLRRMATALEPTVAADDVLDFLTRKHIVTNDYWAKTAIPGRQCDGQYVANLIHAAAGPFADAELLVKYGSPARVLPNAEPAAFNLAGPNATADSFNYIIGTQTIGATYQFTEKSRLVETAEAIRALGSTVIKFELGPHYAGVHGNTATALRSVHSLAELAASEPSHRRVLDMPFAHFILWAHTFSGGEGKWRNGFSEADRAAEYREIYELAAHLLRTYNKTGKTFYLGHWEGDGFLRGSVAIENDAKVTPEAVQGMADWLNTRQRAVDDAKHDIVHEGVEVWHYTEVNHVRIAMRGRPALVNRVLPRTAVDLVSYSSYDTQEDPAMLKAALNFIESKLPPKPRLTGRRVFIGEYGFPASRFTPAEQGARSRAVIRAGLEWGAPFILYWELYNNEIDSEGKQRGFWLIDDHGVKQPIYETHRRFLEWARGFVGGAKTRSGPTPSDNEFRKAAVQALDAMPPD